MARTPVNSELSLMAAAFDTAELVLRVVDTVSSTALVARMLTLLITTS